MLLALAPTWYIWGHLGKFYLGSGEIDGWLWRYWWMKQLLSSLWSHAPRNWGLLAYTFFTAGSYPETGNVLDLQLMSMPMEAILGDPAYYNVKIFLILVLNGLSGYVLFKYISRCPALSLLGPVLMVLNPYVISEIADGRPRQAILFSIPLFIVSLLESFRAGTIRSAALAGLWMGLTAAIYLYYGMAALFFLLIFVICKGAESRGRLPGGFVRGLPLMLLIFVAVAAPFSFRYLEMSLKRETLPEVIHLEDVPPVEYLQREVSTTYTREERPRSLQRLRHSSLPFDFPVHQGRYIYVPLFFLAAALLPLFFIRPIPYLWLISAFFFYMLALGPYLKAGTSLSGYVITLSGQAVPLPYCIFFKYVPFFSRLFAPSRLLGFFFPLLLALAAHNISRLLGPPAADEGSRPGGVWGGRVFRYFLCALAAITAFVQISLGWLPLPLTATGVPAFYQGLAHDRDRFGLIELPLGINFTDYVNYYQVRHGKKVLPSWAIGQVPPGFPDCPARYLSLKDYRDDNTYLRHLEGLKDIPPAGGSFKKEDMESLKSAGYRYLVLHEEGCYIYNQDLGRETYDFIFERLAGLHGPPAHQEVFRPAGRSAARGEVDGFRIAVFPLQARR
jgi:hypothetical protein